MKELAAVVGCILALLLILGLIRGALRRNRIRRKYGPGEIADAIIHGRYWVGQTAEQLIDAKGNPVDIDQRVLKTKEKQTWKYHQTGRNRFALRIVVENGVVVGWDQKN